MIVTVANCAPADIGALVAENMAVLHARTGRKMLLLDASRRQACARWGAGRARSRLRPVVATRAVRGSGFSEQLERLQARYDDVAIVVDTDGGNGLECRCALIAAHVALVPLAPDLPEQEEGARHRRRQASLINLTNEVTMDIVFIGAIVLFAALIWGMTNGCARLGERK